MDLVKHLEAAKEFQRIQNIFQEVCLSAFLYVHYGKKYPINCNCWCFRYLLSHLAVALTHIGNYNLKGKLMNIAVLRNTVFHQKYCKYGTNTFNVAVEDLEYLREWLVTEVKKLTTYDMMN